MSKKCHFPLLRLGAIVIVCTIYTNWAPDKPEYKLWSGSLWTRLSLRPPHFRSPPTPFSSILKGKWAQKGAILRRQTFLKTKNFSDFDFWDPVFFDTQNRAFWRAIDAKMATCWDALVFSQNRAFWRARDLQIWPPKSFLTPKIEHFEGQLRQNVAIWDDKNF
jgi:hypothetical protein